MEDRETSNDDEIPDGMLDFTIIQEDSLDESQGTDEDLNHTLQEELALRKNLDNAFADAQKSKANAAKASERSSIKQRIAHFERKLAENNKTSTGVIAAAPKLPPIPSRVAEIGNVNQDSKQLKVYLRLRPCAESEDSLSLQVVTPNKAAGEVHPTKIRTNPSNETYSEASAIAGGKKDALKEFEFTQVFGKESSQMEVYEKTAAPLVSRLCIGNRAGQSSLLFTYGITNAGKTYTVLGDTQNGGQMESWGIVPRCLRQILEKVSNTDLKVYLSYFEIYNENVFDLLPKTPAKATVAVHVDAKPLKIRDRNGQTVIKGLTKYPIETLEQGLQVVSKAKESRHTATNHLNRHSSRSHSVCQLTVTLTPESEEGDDDCSVDTSKLLSSRPEDAATLWIVDLAGSERSKRTNVGSVRQKEAAFINKSLMTLMGCLTRGERNYRDSKLTVLFMHHWMKSGPTTMIVNVHPSREDYDETQHVLAYAISTKNIPKPERKNGITSCSLNTNQLEYGYNGHKKTEVNKDAKPKKLELKPAAVTKIPVSRVQRKRKSSLLTRRETKPAQRKHAHSLILAAAAPLAKKHKLSESTAEAPKALCTELLLAKKEIESLKAKNQALVQDMEAAETVVRAEVADEMLEQMTSMTKRHELKIHELKARIAESSKHHEDRKKLERAQVKIQELTDQVAECEEEMVRMTEGHAEERRQASEAIADREKIIIQLKNELEELRSQASKLKKSKEELVKNYERLLSEEGDEDDEHSHDEANSPKRGKHYRKPLQCRTEPRVRRPLGIRSTPYEKQESINNAIPCPITGMNGNLNKSQSEADSKGTESKPRLPLAKRSMNLDVTMDRKTSFGQLIYPEKQARQEPEGTGSFPLNNAADPTGVSD